MMRLRGQTNNGMVAKYDVNKLAVDSIASEGRWGATGACRRIEQMEVLDFAEHAELISTFFFTQKCLHWIIQGSEWYGPRLKGMWITIAAH
jgi:hypothetical protein